MFTGAFSLDKAFAFHSEWLAGDRNAQFWDNTDFDDGTVG